VVDILLGTLTGFRASRDERRPAKPVYAVVDILLGTLTGFRTSRDERRPAKPVYAHAISICFRERRAGRFHATISVTCLGR
jgi:hypothetical protein